MCPDPISKEGNLCSARISLLFTPTRTLMPRSLRTAIEITHSLYIVLWSDRSAAALGTISKRTPHHNLISWLCNNPRFATQERRERKGKTAFNTEHSQGNRVHPPTVSCNGLSLPRARSLPPSGCCRCLSSSSSRTLLSDTSSFAFISASWKASDRPRWADWRSWKAQRLRGAFKPCQPSADRCKGVDVVACKIPSHWLAPPYLQAPLLCLQWRLLMILGKFSVGVASVGLTPTSTKKIAIIYPNEFSFLMVFFFFLLQFRLSLWWCTSKWSSQRHKMVLC